MSHVDYRGIRFYIQSTNRYYAADKRCKPYRLLHRYVWWEVNGMIPRGHHIHHKDGNWKNNDISNLECISGIEHARSHMKARYLDPEFVIQNNKNLLLAQEAAKIWHASEEGRSVHVRTAKDQWKDKAKSEKICIVCAKPFMTYFANRVSTRFCSKSCAQAGCYAKQKTLKKNCGWCGVEFLANKYRNVICCSKLCSNRKRGFDSKNKCT